MTIRNAYEYALIECNKLKAPALLLEDYIYLFNKAIQQYVNGVYNRAEYNQQSSDDLGWLQKVQILNEKVNLSDYTFHGNVSTFKLPEDYIHLLNCKAQITKSSNPRHCLSNEDLSYKLVNCTRLTANLDGGICENYYNKPSNKKPYFYIVNRDITLTPDIEDDDIIESPDIQETPDTEDEVVTEEYYYNYFKEKGSRKCNQNPIYIEIHLGESQNNVNAIQVTYLRSPQYVSMTHEELLALEDGTQTLEFPDYVCYEIINIFVKLLLENSGDPRLTTNVPVNQSIAAN